MIIVEKLLGETPLECLERIRAERNLDTGIPMTYAGRLDPLATGKLLILVGDECKEKDKYLGLDKEYEIEVLFGVRTDTGDMLGLVTGVGSALTTAGRGSDMDTSAPTVLAKMTSWKKFEGKFAQAYPPYSSKTVRRPALRAAQLHELARAGDLPDEMPTKEVEIYSIEEIGKGEMTSAELAARAVEAVLKVRGDFRQDQIVERWKDFASKYGDVISVCAKLKVSCSSGTYMRALAERMGGMAISIHRTKVGEF